MTSEDHPHLSLVPRTSSGATSRQRQILPECPLARLSGRVDYRVEVGPGWAEPSGCACGPPGRSDQVFDARVAWAAEGRAIHRESREEALRKAGVDRRGMGGPLCSSRQVGTSHAAWPAGFLDVGFPWYAYT